MLGSKTRLMLRPRKRPRRAFERVRERDWELVRKKLTQVFGVSRVGVLRTRQGGLA